MTIFKYMLAFLRDIYIYITKKATYKQVRKIRKKPKYNRKNKSIKNQTDILNKKVDYDYLLEVKKEERNDLSRIISNFPEYNEREYPEIHDFLNKLKTRLKYLEEEIEELEQEKSLRKNKR